MHLWSLGVPWFDGISFPQTFPRDGRLGAGSSHQGLCTRTRRSTGWFDRRVGVVSEELMQLRGRGGSRGAFSAGCRLRRV
jgi:hypothetical protein